MKNGCAVCTKFKEYPEETWELLLFSNQNLQNVYFNRITRSLRENSSEMMRKFLVLVPKRLVAKMASAIRSPESLATRNSPEIDIQKHGEVVGLFTQKELLLLNYSEPALAETQLNLFRKGIHKTRSLFPISSVYPWKPDKYENRCFSIANCVKNSI